MLPLKETFVEDVWVLVSVISEKKVVPSCLLKQRKAVQRHGFVQACQPHKFKNLGILRQKYASSSFHQYIKILGCVCVCVCE